MNTDPTVQFGREAEKYLTSQVHADSEALAELVALVEPTGGHVLDIATGAGHMAFAMAPFVDQVTASDPTPEMLRVTGQEAARRGLDNVQVSVAFAENLPFEDGTFDGVTCRVAAHHFLDVPQFVRETNRVLRPGGWFLLVDTVSPEDKDAAIEINAIETIRDPSHKWNLSPSEWAKVIENSDFEVLKTQHRIKTLNLQEWMDRMSVAPVDQASLKVKILESEGIVREYLRPTPESFALEEIALFCRKLQ